MQDDARIVSLLRFASSADKSPVAFTFDILAHSYVVDRDVTNDPWLDEDNNSHEHEGFGRNEAMVSSRKTQGYTECAQVEENLSTRRTKVRTKTKKVKVKTKMKTMSKRLCGTWTKFE